MHMKHLYEAGATSRRIRYALANILRDRVVDDGAFRVCFEMEDEDAVIRTILIRGLKNPRLRTALERSHLIDITHWLSRYPDLTEAYLEETHPTGRALRSEERSAVLPRRMIKKKGQTKLAITTEHKDRRAMNQ